MQLLLVLCLTLPLLCQAGLTGAPVNAKIDESDPSVQFALGAINDYYAKQGDNALRTLTQVVSAQTQVVSGTLYHLVLKVSAGGQYELCEVKVWSRPWLSGDEATQVTQDPACKPVVAATKPPMVGGETLVDVNNADVHNALMFAVQTMNAQENYMFNRKPINIESATSQVVSGIVYRFRGVHMASTDCVKGSSTLLEDCQTSINADTRVCDFDIWWQSWMTPEYKITNLKCQ